MLHKTLLSIGAVIIMGLGISSIPSSAVLSAFIPVLEAEASVHTDTVRTPTILLTLGEWPRLHDDLDLEGMELAIERQLVKFQRLSRGKKIRLGHITYDFKVFQSSLKAFLVEVKTAKSCIQATKDQKACFDSLNTRMKQKFHMFAPVVDGQVTKTFFTAYHTPVIEASLKKDAVFKVGIHQKPIESSLRSLTRNQINFDNRLLGTPYEAMYMKDYFEQYLLHIQGGGKVVYKDVRGKTHSKYLNYDGTNGQPFRFISRYMRDQGYISDMSNESQKAFLDANPHKQREIYNYSPSVVYFQFADEPPHGNDAVSLTDNRSIATDYRIYKSKGLVTFVKAKRPLAAQSNEWRDFSRFYIDHDTGGAIRGAARADLYFGEDDYAAYVASMLKDHGEMYFLALRPEFL